MAKDKALRDDLFAPEIMTDATIKATVMEPLKDMLN